MAITFPNSPSSGDTHTTSNGLQYTYDGEKWTTIGTNSAGTWTRSGTTVSLTTAGDDLNVDSGTLFVDASTNNVGVGTTSPADLLEIKGSFPKFSIVDSDTTNDKFSILHNGGGTIFQVDGNNVGPNSSFLITQIDGTERMRIDSSGRLLVGTTTELTSQSPSIQLVDTGTAILALGRNDSSISAGNSLGAIEIYGNDGGSYQMCASIAAQADGTHANNDKPTRLLFSTTADGASSPTERLRIDSAGNVGINESTPDSKVDILYSTGTDTATQKLIHLRTDGSGSYASRGLFVKIGRDGPYDNSAAHYDIVGSAGNSGTHIFEVQGNEKMRIDSSGKLLVGTTSDYAENVQAAFYGASNGGIALASGTSGLSRLMFADATAGNAGAYVGSIIYSHSDNSLRFNVNGGTERMRIDSSGFISQKFTSNNSSTPEGLFINNLNNATGNNASIIFSNDSGERKKVAIAAVDVGNYGASDLVFALDAADSGSISLSTDEKMRILSSGGLTFNGDTAQVNALDDYEEGTFTPTAFVGTTALSVSGNTGTYTKIGNTVFFSCRLDSITKSGTGEFSIGGLPYTPLFTGNSNKYSQPTVRYNNINPNGVLVPLFSPNGSRFIFFQAITTSGTLSGVTNSNLSSTCSIYGLSGFYTV